MTELVLIAGCDRFVFYQRLDESGEATEPTSVSVEVELNGAGVEIDNEPVWDDETQRLLLLLLGTEVSEPGYLKIAWKGTDSTGVEFTDVETILVLASDNPDSLLMHRVARFLRIEEDDPALWPLVQAAHAYIQGAGVTRPDSDDTALTAQYDTAVSCYVSAMYSGGDSDLEAPMTSILLQLRAAGGA